MRDKPSHLMPSSITPESVFRERRRWLSLMGGLAAGSLAIKATGSETTSDISSHNVEPLLPTEPRRVKEYNNYYEFGWDKTSPSRLSSALKTRPWTITIDGLCEKPATIDLESLHTRFSSIERICRFRCVEGWSAVIPWSGFRLSEIIQSVAPLSNARYVRFEAVSQPEAMPSQRDGKLLPWPYVEGLRMDEALHPLTLLATGMYGAPLPNQNGAPLRLVVPWKYGFKSIKAVVRIELVESQPVTTWQSVAPSDYGFFANVNPKVPHPRWSQATERPLGDPFYTPRRKTEFLNGYADSVGSLYDGMDLRRFF